MPGNSLAAALLLALVAFALYRRFKRSFGRQQVAPRRMAVRIGVFTLASALFLWWLPTPAGVAAAAAGLLVGGALAALDLAHTVIEQASEGVFYTPNKWIGLTVTSLFVARLCARLLAVYAHSAEIGQGAPSGPEAHGLPRSPLTLAVYFLLAAYYVGYYWGILRRTRALRAR